MYHLRFQGTHYDIGLRWGTRLFGHGKLLLENVPFPITEERIEFAKKCRSYYEEWYPEILEEIRGIAEGQKEEGALFEAVLFGMYCMMPEQKCSCFAFREGEHVLLARNSDFLTELERLYMNCMYRFSGASYGFSGNTTAFAEMEDGVNEYGLAVGLTSVYPSVLGYGMNAGMLLRCGLEKCRNVEEFVQFLEKAPIASSQTFTAADRSGEAALIECNPEKMEVCSVDEKNHFVSAVNAFNLPGMRKYRAEGIDDWRAGERYETIQVAFARHKQEPFAFAADVLGGKYGFMCQYDRKTGKDTVWSVIYDVTGGKIYRCEGNPSRKRFLEDKRIF